MLFMTLQICDQSWNSEVGLKEHIVCAGSTVMVRPVITARGRTKSYGIMIIPCRGLFDLIFYQYITTFH